MEPTEFGCFLRSLREKQRLSLRKAADTAGMSVGYLWQIEKARRTPSAEMLKRLAQAYQVPMQELLSAGGYWREVPESEAEIQRLRLAVELASTDPAFKFGTRLDTGELTPEAMRFILEIYEKATGKKLL